MLNSKLAFYMLLAYPVWAVDIPVAADACYPCNRNLNKAGDGFGPDLTVSSLNNTFIRFDTSVLPLGILPSQIGKATLRVWARSVTTAGLVAVRSVGQSWTEASVDGGVAPMIVSGDLTMFTVGASGVFVLVDVTNLVQQWVVTPSANYGLALSSIGSVHVDFDSKENIATGHEPVITIALSGTNGPAGATGPLGPTGATGLAGPNGPSGPVGPTGSTGAVGSTGLVGATGTQGLVGATGVTGTIGPIGLTGSTGTAGLAGATGPAGVTGTPGTTGTQGLVGATGVTGTIGPIGLTGATGTAGGTGLAGATGPAGVTGTPGTAGTQGLVGATGVTGAAGPIGLTGSTGAVGGTGLVGATGTQGLVGVTGVTGPVGATGVGTDGITGPVGPRGATGPSGPSGPVGSTGVVGGTGPVGVTGTTGATGVTGPAGASNYQAVIMNRNNVPFEPGAHAEIEVRCNSITQRVMGGIGSTAHDAVTFARGAILNSTLNVPEGLVFDFRNNSGFAVTTTIAGNIFCANFQ